MMKPITSEGRRPDMSRLFNLLDSVARNPKKIIVVWLLLFLFFSGIFFAWHTLIPSESVQGGNGQTIVSSNAYQIKEKESPEAAQQSEIGAICGNGVCEPTEGCATCPNDCACSQGMICDRTRNVCVAEKHCGDGICQEGEELSCCIDCGCPEDQVCINNTCVKIEKVPEDSRSKYALVIATLVEEKYSVNTNECNISLETIESAKTIGAEFDCPGSIIVVEYDPESNTLVGGGIIPK